MRKRKRDLQQRVYKYRIDNIEVPESVWTVAREQQRLWNELVALHAAARQEAERIYETDSKATKESAKLVWEDFDAKAAAAIKASTLNWVMGPQVLDRFRAACKLRGSAAHHEWPSERRSLLPILLTDRFTGGGLPVEQFWTMNSARIRFGPARPGHGHRAFEFSIRHQGVESQYLRGRVIFHRPLPADSIVKQIGFSGRRNALGWQWYMLITVEERAPVAAMDVGWRKIEANYIRVGVLADSQGRLIELGLPLIRESKKIARTREWREEKGGYYYRDCEDLETINRRADALLEAVKDRIRLHMQSNGHLSAEAQGKIAYLSQMRHRGLRELGEILRRNHEGDELVAILKEWSNSDYKLARDRQRLYDRLVNSRKWWYGNLGVWLAKSYTALNWEGKLGVKEMIEEEGVSYALEAGRFYHQLAATYDLRQIIKNAAAKWGCEIQDGTTAGSTAECHVCKALTSNSGKLRLTCPNGHEWDQDVNAALNLLFTQTSEVSLQEWSLRNRLWVQAGQVLDLPKELRAVARACSV